MTNEHVLRQLKEAIDEWPVTAETSADRDVSIVLRAKDWRTIREALDSGLPATEASPQHPSWCVCETCKRGPIGGGLPDRPELESAFREGWLACEYMSGTLSCEECWEQSETRELSKVGLSMSESFGPSSCRHGNDPRQCLRCQQKKAAASATTREDETRRLTPVYPLGSFETFYRADEVDARLIAVATERDDWKAKWEGVVNCAQIDAFEDRIGALEDERAEQAEMLKGMSKVCSQHLDELATLKQWMIDRGYTLNGAREIKKDRLKLPDFCGACGASIPKREGEGTCEKCDPKGVAEHKVKSTVPEDYMSDGPWRSSR